MTSCTWRTNNSRTFSHCVYSFMGVARWGGGERRGQLPNSWTAIIKVLIKNCANAQGRLFSRADNSRPTQSVSGHAPDLGVLCVLVLKVKLSRHLHNNNERLRCYQWICDQMWIQAKCFQNKLNAGSRNRTFRSGRFGLSRLGLGHFGHDIFVHEQLITFVYLNGFTGRRNVTLAGVIPTPFWGVMIAIKPEL